MDFLRKNSLIVVGLLLVFFGAMAAGYGIKGTWLAVIIGGGVIALGAAQRQKAGRD